MSLLGALNIGQSSLAIQQAAIQVTGNNISNAGNADYSRQVVDTSPGQDQQIKPGVFVGTGATLDGIQRQVDDALNARIRSGVSDSTAAATTQQWLSQVESTFNALGTDDLAKSMGDFFSSWSTLANQPQSVGQRQAVLQQGDTLAGKFQSIRGELTDLGANVAKELSTQTSAADQLASQIAGLNGQIVTAEAGQGSANDLRDQRDAALKKLAQLVNVSTVQQPNGSVNVYVGSEPLVINTTSSGLTLQNTPSTAQTPGGTTIATTTPTVVFKNNNEPAPLGNSGALGALGDVQARINGFVSQEDSLAHTLIFELNKLHASGQGGEGISQATSTNAVKDPTAALNSATAGLEFQPNNGSFVVHVRQKATGLVTSTLVQVNLTGSAADTSLNSLAASLNAINGVTASVAGGKLTIASANSAVDLTFSQDSSGTLAALGINTFYSGTDASNIAVNAQLAGQPQLLAAAKNGDPTDNQTALAIAALGTTPIASQGGASLNDQYQSLVGGVGAQTAAAKTEADATQAVVNTLQAQRDSLSGVSLDEEAINLMRQQRAFQGAAKLITTIDDMMNTVIGILR